MIKAIKIRIYPQEDQITYINKLLGCCRFIYNKLLAYKIEEYTKNKNSVGFKELGKYLTWLKQQEEYLWLNEVHSKVLQQSLIDLNKAYHNFFINSQGFPKFKSKKDNKNSCRFPVDAIIGIIGNRITLIRNLKDVHFKCSVQDEIYLNNNQGLIKSCSITKTKSNRYYLSVLIEDTRIKDIKKPINKIIGIDLGVKTLIKTSSNEDFNNLKLGKKYGKRLKKLQRELSKKEIGSNNRNKVRIKLAKLNEKVHNIKENYLHEVVNKLLNENQVVVMEDLNVSGMMKNHKLAGAIQDLSLNRFKNILSYKANWYNRDIIEIDRWYPSSKLCSNCGSKKKDLKLSDREWTCSVCGAHHDRDLNAAINIRNEGQRLMSIKKIDDFSESELKI